MKTKKNKYWLTALIAIVMTMAVASCEDEDIGIIGTCPEIESTNPTDLQTGVPFDQAITATFKEAVDPQTVNGATFTISGTSTIGGTVTYSGKTATFTPSSLLLPNTTYTGRVTRGVKDLMGNAMLEDYVWTFTTGLLPTVIAVDPANDATGVNLDKVVTATFSTGMNPATINNSTFTVKNGFNTVEGTVTYSGFTATFTPTSPLMANTTYTGTITNGASNTAGSTIAANYVWTFSTDSYPMVISTDPTNNATNVNLAKVITATFSVPMEASTINGSTFTLRNGIIPISGTITYSGNTASFTPSVALLPNSTYTASINTGAENTLGTSLNSNYVWSFSTQSAPTVISTNPIEGQSGVLPNQVISATFSEAVQSSTIIAANFTVNNGTSNIGGFISMNGNTVSFTPATPLEANVSYTATISANVKNTAGISMANDYVWTFSTASAPSVTQTTPENGETGVALNTNLTATFDREMNSSSINPSSFMLSSGSTSVAGTITYSGNTATFNPNSALAPNTTYTATITTEANDNSGYALGADYTWTFNTIESPSIISTIPANNAVNVSLDNDISATFNMAMDPLTINALTFTLKAGNAPVVGTVSYSNNTAVFNPTGKLIANTTYTAMISTTARNTAGAALATNYIWTFTTATPTTPTVITTSPENEEENVALNKAITATFSVPMDVTTLNGASFKLKRGNTIVAGTTTYNTSTSTATFTPSSLLNPSTEYTATITTNAKNTEGTSISEDYVWSFTTVGPAVPFVLSTDPINNATGVELNKIVKATFSVPMDPLTLNASTFTLKNGATTVAGVISYTGSTVSFDPAVDLMPNTTYTATITNGAKNVAGTAMANNFTWSFTTQAFVSPFVVSTDPANQAMNVVINKVIRATFSVPMNPATLNNATFTLSNGSTPIAGIVTYSGNTASFTPLLPLSANSVYTGRITTGASNMAGNGLASDYVWTFMTGSAVAPMVISTDPGDQTTGTLLNKVITATFNMPMNSLTLNSLTFTLKNGSIPVIGVVSYSGNTASFDPTASLLPNTLYTGTITTGARNPEGISMVENYVWTFRTGGGDSPLVILTDPLDTEINVETNKTVTATFNQAMNGLSISPSTFTLKRGTVNILGAVSYSGNTASFNPTLSLQPGTTYTATITTGVRSSVGTPMASNYSWTFTTKPVAPPVVTSTDPDIGATNVVLNKTLEATFDVAMDGASINASSFTLANSSGSVAGAIYTIGNKAFFNPTVNFTPSTTYTATITSNVKNSAGINMVSDYQWTFETGAILAPVVTSVDPLNNATNVAIDKTLTADFNMVMDPTTITTSTFTLKNGANTVSALVSYLGTTATLNPINDLLPGTTYTATITTGTKNAGGVALANNYVWTFTTASSAPLVTSVDPLNNALNVAINKTISANFNMTMDPLTITSGTFTLKNGANTVLGQVSYSGNTATLNPISDLLPGTTYTASITTGAESTSGVNLANNYVWTFTTASAVAPTVILTNPLNNAMNVNINASVNATFSVPMDMLTINSTTFTVKVGANTVAGTISYVGSTATFTPTGGLQAGTTYTATITTGAKNLAGTGLVNNHVWTFTTASAVAPTVILTNPLNNAMNVSLNALVSATFSVPMDMLTINGSTFTVKVGANIVPGTISLVGSTATFTPIGGLQSGTTYTATITTGAKNLAGTSLANNYVWTFSTVSPLGPNFIDIGSMDEFGIFAATGISNNAGPSVINNLDVGIYPGVRSSVTGFPPGLVVGGAIFAMGDLSPAGVDARLLLAKNEATAAYLQAQGATNPAPSTVSGDQGGLTLAPGIYKSTSSLSVAGGNLTLDAQGDANAVWIFQIASTLTTVGGTGGNIILTGGAQAKNIFWQVGTSATIGNNTIFYGNVLAYTSITMNTGAVATGRMIALNGAVVLTGTNTINKP